MRLVAIISRLNELDEDLTIYARKPWTCDSDSLVAHEPREGGLPQDALRAEMSYFIEVFIAKDFIAGWIASQAATPADEEICARLIRYAMFDA